MANSVEEIIDLVNKNGLTEAKGTLHYETEDTSMNYNFKVKQVPGKGIDIELRTDI